MRLRAISLCCLLFVLLPSLAQAALTSLPLRITVQRGDTVEFCPMIKGWSATLSGVTVSATTPAQGTLTTLPSFFTGQKFLTNPRNFSYDTVRYCPRNFPGFRYIPAPGFTGRVTFTFTIRTLTDSTAPTPCEILVSPPEPGGTTVLVVVNQLLLPNITAEVSRLKADLDHEGYAARIVPFPDYTDIADTAACRRLWDTLSAEYSAPGRFLSGAILIGRLPFPNDIRNINKDVFFWSMSAWLHPLELDTVNPYIGVRVMNAGKSKGLYTRSVPNIWISRITGVSSYVSFGPEADIVKRVLQANHDYRTGASRLPSGALYYNLRTLEEPNMDSRRLLGIWPSLYVRPKTDSTVSPLYHELRVGGDVWDLSCHAGGGQEYRSYMSTAAGIVYIFKVTVKDLANSHVQTRCIIAQNCHSGVPGRLAPSSLMSRNNKCVLVISSADYAQEWGELSPADTSRWPGTVRFRACLAEGDRWGRSWQRSNMSLWGTAFFGDLSLKPNMTPHNETPVLSSFSARNTGPLSWRFTVNASDADGSIAQYEWFPAGYNSGKAVPYAASSSASSIDYTFASANVCTLRVEAEDNYKARDFLQVVFKPDSGVVRMLTPYLSGGSLAVQEPARVSAPAFMSARPNPFTNRVEITGGDRASRICLYDAAGRLVASARGERLSWRAGCSGPGIYVARVMKGSGKKASLKIVRLN